MSRIVLGCEPLGGTDWGTTDAAAAAAALEEALTCGITAFDVADIYGLGRAETLLGKTLRGRTSGLLVMTKGGVRWWASGSARARTAADGSRAYLRQAVQGSLERLQMDSIPLYFLHRPDSNVPIEESVEALAELVQAGLLGAIGLSNVGPSEVRRAHAAYPLAAVEFEYSLLRRTAEADLIPTCRELGIAALAHGPLAQGLLTGKYSRESRFGSDDRRHRLPLFSELANGDHDKALECLQTVAERRLASPAQLALRWVLDHAEIAAVIVGAKDAGQVRDNVSSLDLDLDARDRELLNLVGSGRQ